MQFKAVTLTYSKFLPKIILVLFAAVSMNATIAVSQTIYNIPTKNIFDTTDPICNGNDSSIVFCDGFEDGAWVASDDGFSGSAANDYWLMNGMWVGGNVFFPSDPQGRAFAECGTANTQLANFGAAGTRCTATQGWANNSQHGANGAHWMLINGTNPGSPRATGIKNYYLRMYFKEAGVTSTRCSTGAPCPAFLQNGSNGYKLVEFANLRETAGINGSVCGQMNPPTLIGFGSTAQCHVNHADTGIAGGVQALTNLLYSPHNQGNPFSHQSYRDEWIFLEIHAVEDVVGVGKYEVWMDRCGRNGLGCTGQPTLRSRVTGYDFSNVRCGAARSFWVNFWNSSATGEIQFDEVVIRNGEVRDAPIGFFGSGSGDTIAPAAPQGLQVN